MNARIETVPDCAIKQVPAVTNQFVAPASSTCRQVLCHAPPLKLHCAYLLSPALRPVPLSCNAKAAPPAVFVVGLRLVSTGSAATFRNNVGETPPPGAGFVTRMLSVLGVASSAAGSVTFR